MAWPAWQALCSVAVGRVLAQGEVQTAHPFSGPLVALQPLGGAPRQTTGQAPDCPPFFQQKTRCGTMSHIPGLDPPGANSSYAFRIHHVLPACCPWRKATLTGWIVTNLYYQTQEAYAYVNNGLEILNQ